MKLKEKSKILILKAISEYDKAFGPSNPQYPGNGHPEWAKQISFAMPSIQGGNIPAVFEQAEAVTRAVAWYEKSFPSEDASETVSDLQEYTVNSEFPNQNS